MFGKEDGYHEARLKQDGTSKYPDVLHRRYSDLFFTNLIPGCRRSEKSTGGFMAAWITEQVRSDFRDLLEMLCPQVVVCLGKDTFKTAVKIAGKTDPAKGMSWNEYLDSDFEPIEIKLDSEKSTFLFPMPHPGYFGKQNRNKSKKGKTMDDDWDGLSDWLERTEKVQSI